MKPDDDEPPEIPDHQLVRRVGVGSYGEVWLAHTATGTPRAVKIVHRARFADDRPYEREFAGLRHFEPISRAHDGLVDVLQIGRHDTAGVFYYVMELADDASEAPGAGGQTARAALRDPAAYRPRTLEAIMHTKPRMAVAECVRIGVALAEALAYLHGAGLAHRDLKPSNIIFVGGVPKLADVGLVARTDSARSFVGTEGFVPPEGPGSPRADIYGLGKCLYEMAMGKDRQAFPSPPTGLDELPDRAELLELNEIITKASHPEPGQRHPSARELATELGILLAGQSVKQARRQRRWRRRAAGCAGVLGTLALAWSAAWLLRTSRLVVVREFPMLGNWPAHSARLGHFNGNLTPELLDAADGHLSVTTLEGETRNAGSPPGIGVRSLELQLVTDANGDGKEEAFVGWREGTNLHVSMFNQQLTEISRCEALGSAALGKAGPYPISSLVALRVLLATPQRPAALLASVKTGLPAMWPRGVRLYDLTSRTQLWDFPFPSMAVHKVVIVPDGPAAGRIVLSTQSHDNGAKLNGDDDGHSYVYALSPEGRLGWKVEAGPDHVQVEPWHAKLHGTNYLFAAAVRHFESIVEARAPGANLWQPTVLKLDLDTGDAARREVARFTTNSPILSVTVADLEGRGAPVALAPCGDGSLLVLDADQLRLIRRLTVVTKARTNDWVDLRIVAVADLDHDGRPEVVLSAHQIKFVSGRNTSDPQGEANERHISNRVIIVLDHRLRPLARHRFPGGVDVTELKALVADREAAGSPVILALGSKVTVLRFERR